MTLRYALLADGPSDRALLSVLRWTLRTHLDMVELVPEVVDLGRIRRPPDRSDLSGRIEKAFDLSPCDVLFVHRDAEQAGALDIRRQEIVRAAAQSSVRVPVVPVVPMRMTEAWLLSDEPALRAAAGNPAGTVPLRFPAPVQLERIHAKDELSDLLRAAAALSGRKAKQFSAAEATQRLADLIDDFSPLRHLPSFQAFEADVAALAAGSSRLLTGSGQHARLRPPGGP